MRPVPLRFCLSIEDWVGEVVDWLLEYRREEEDKVLYGKPKLPIYFSVPADLQDGEFALYYDDINLWLYTKYNGTLKKVQFGAA